MPEQHDETRRQGGSATAGETTGAGVLQQSASPGDGRQFGSDEFGSDDGRDGGQQSQRGASNGHARQPGEMLRETASQLRREGTDAARQAEHELEAFADDRKNRVSGYVRTVSQAMRAGAETLQGDGFGASAGALSRLAGDIDEFAETLKARDPRQLVEDMSALARGNPALFLGASLFAGFGGARFLKSAMPEQDPAQAQGVPARQAGRPAGAAAGNTP